MKERLFLSPCQRVLLIFSVILTFMTVVTVQAQTTTASEETTVIDGKTYIAHPINAKDTYYLLSRIYEVPVKEIMEVNNKKASVLAISHTFLSRTTPWREKSRSQLNAQKRLQTLDRLGQPQKKQ